MSSSPTTCGERRACRLGTAHLPVPENHPGVGRRCPRYTLIGNLTAVELPMVDDPADALADTPVAVMDELRE
jgi:hypothetical protein